jgi:hypothetical protein
MKTTTYCACMVALAVTAWPLAPPAASQRCYPTTRFEVLPGNFVRDTLTQLVWQRRASSKIMDWEAADAYCSSSGFRLPTVKELASLVDLTVTSGPMIDQTAFPDTPTFLFWTSTRLAGAPENVWCINFSSGYWNFDLTIPHFRVRCVREDRTAGAGL